MVLMIVAFALTAPAQRAGFTAGLAPATSPAATVPGTIGNPVQPFVSAPVQGFGRFGTTTPMTPPIITTTYSPIYSNFQSPAVAVGVPLLQSWGFYSGSGLTLIVPNGTVIANTAVIIQPQGQFFSAGPVAARTVNPVPSFQPPSAGSSRADVIQQFGTPATSVMTQHSETLYFTGGVTVVLQDGKVVSPQRPN